MQRRTKIAVTVLWAAAAAMSGGNAIAIGGMVSDDGSLPKLVTFINTVKPRNVNEFIATMKQSGVAADNIQVHMNGGYVLTTEGLFHFAENIDATSIRFSHIHGYRLTVTFNIAYKNGHCTTMSKISTLFGPFPEVYQIADATTIIDREQVTPDGHLGATVYTGGHHHSSRKCITQFMVVVLLHG